MIMQASNTQMNEERRRELLMRRRELLMRKKAILEERRDVGRLPVEREPKIEDETRTLRPEISSPTSYERAIREAKGPFQKLAVGVTGGLERALYGAVQPFLPEEKQQRLGEIIGAQKEAEREVGAPARIGGFVGEVAPYIAVPGRGIPALAAGGAAATYLQPREEAITQEERLKEAAVGGAISAGVGAVVPIVKKGVQKVFNVNPQAVQEFAETGVEPALGEVSERGSIKRIQTFLQKVPGSSGRLETVREKTVNKIKKGLEEVGKVSPVTQQEAGALIQKGAKEYVSKFKNVSRKMYDKLDKYISPNETININNTNRLLRDQIQEFAESPELQRRIAGSTSGRILQDILADADKFNGKLPYKSLKKYRSIVGEELGDQFTIGDRNRDLLKRIYGSLSEDMSNTFSQKGSAAMRSFERANNFYREGATKIEDSLQRIINSDAPETIYRYALSGTKLGGTRINNIMKSISNEEKDILRSTVINRIGFQESTGEFSPAKFLTEFNKISPEAKNAIFSTEQRTSLNNFAKVIERIKKVDATGNFSNTTPHAILGLLGAGALGGVTGGAPGGIMAVGTALGAANITARLMTSHKFINWLADATTKQTPGVLSKHLEKLGIIASRNKELRKDILNYLESINQQNIEEER
jgi:hypothetical protein